MKALFRGIFRCRVCGQIHGAYGVQVAQYEVWYPSLENGMEADRCPRCNHLDCQFLSGTRIPPIVEDIEMERPSRKRRGGWIPSQKKKAG